MAFTARAARSFLPVANDASIFIETAPGLIINRITDVALKATQVTPAIMVVERAFGLLEIHHRDKGQVMQGGEAVLAHLGIEETDRLKPRVVSDQVIRAVEPYHAQVINKSRYGDMLIAGESLLILETEPAGYIAFGANEALKAAHVKLIDASLFGATAAVLGLKPDQTRRGAAPGLPRAPKNRRRAWRLSHGGSPQPACGLQRLRS